MKLFKKNTRTSWVKWVGMSMLMISTGLYSCDSSQNQQGQDSNLGEEQTDFTVDTTGKAGRAGTDEAVGRADTDTSSTGRQMSADTVNRK